MKIYVSVIVTLSMFLVAASAFCAQPTRNLKKHSLNDSQLDAITAGTASSSAASGGVVAVDDSTATIKKDGTLTMDGGAQAQTKALNLVNSVDSGVANGVNVWDGRLPTPTSGTAAPSPATSPLTVTQTNNVSQAQGVTASLPSYIRPNANVDYTSQGSSHSSSQSSSNSMADYKDIQQNSLTRNLTSASSVDTQTQILGQEIKAGKGLAGSGDINVNFDAGQINFAAGIGVGQVLSGQLTLGIQLPQLSVKFDGSICAVMQGSCQAQGSEQETKSSLTDHSHSTSESSTMASMEDKTWNVAKHISAPITVTGVKAEYIVADNSTLNAESNYAVTLGGTTQQSAEALDLINAAGSMVTNAVNVGRAPSLGPQLNLNQINIVNQRM